MKIQKIKLNNYKKFKDYTLDLTSGLNVVYGNNESGKSTIAKAFLDLLYTDPSTNARSTLDNIKSWDGAEAPRLEMIFNSGVNEFLLVKDFAKKELLLENRDSGAKITEYKKSIEAIKAITGIASEEIYETTAFIDQGDVVKVAGNKNLLHEVSNHGDVSNTDVATASVIKTLKSELANLRRGLDRPANNPGELKVEQDTITRLEKELAEKKSWWEKRQTASDTKESSDVKLKEVSEKIENISKLLENNRLKATAEKELIDINNQIEKLEEKLQELGKIETQEIELNQKLEQYEKFTSPDLEKHNQQLSENEGVLKVMREQLNSVLKDAEVVTPSEVKPSKPVKKFLLIEVGVFAVFSLVSVALFSAQQSLLVPALVFSVGILSVIGVYIWSVLSSKLDKQNETKQELRDSGVSLRQDLESKIATAENNISTILKIYDVDSTQDFFAGKAELSGLLMNKNDVISRKNALTGQSTIEDLNREQRELSIKKKDIEANQLTEDVINAKLSQEQVYAKKKVLDKLKIEKTRLEADVIAADTRIGDNTIEYKDIVALEEELTNRKSNLLELIKNEKVLTLSIEAMEAAMSEFARSANEILKEYVESKLSELTNARYSKIRVEDDLQVSVYSVEKNDWVNPVSNLSRGTIDQIYFLTRLAFVNLLTDDKSVPIILDDPFVTADPLRLDSIRRLLDEASKDYQILLFTNDEEYLEWGNAISL